MTFDISYLGMSKDSLPLGWREDRFDNIVDFNPEQVNSDYPHLFIEYLDISNVGRGSIGKSEHLALVNAPSRAKRIVRACDTILSTVRPGNRAYAFLKEVSPNLVVSTGFAVLRAKYCDPRFLYYLATCDPLINYLASIAEEKTAYPSVNPGDIAECRVPIPSIYEQHTIARILGSLDDKIELNRQMNETLEAMARAIFKSWFIDCDPVRSKSDGRDMGLPSSVNKLFPDAFETIDGREVPKGWKIAILEDYIEAVKGLSYKGVGLCEDGVPLHNLNSVLEGGGYKYPGIKYYNGEYKDRHIVKSGDVIVTNTEQGFDFLLIGYPAIIPKYYGEGGLFSHHLFRVRPRENSPLTNHFIYYLLLTPYIRDQVIACTNGTTVNMMFIDGLKTPQFILPPAKIILLFENIVSPMFDTMENNEQQSRTLTALRDALLPKLMSGEINVNEVNGIVQEGTHG
jgi:type I restriction enzyme S subunit